MALQRAGARVLAELNKTITAPESQASGRYLLEGSRPSGNSRIM